MNASMDPLRQGLADLAEEVRPVDLRDRALRTSRRMAVRQAIVTSTAVVAVLGVVSGVAFAMLPQLLTTTPPTPLPDASLSSPAVVNTAKVLPGRLFYLSPQSPVQVYTWDGDTVTKVLEPAGTSWLTPRVSPDGRKLAWISDARQLFVANADGSGVRKVRDEVGLGCAPPVWAADSRRVIAIQPSPVRVVPGTVYEIGYVDVESGSFQWTGVGGCNTTLAPGDAYLAYVDATLKVSVARPDGTGNRIVPVLGNSDPQVNPQRVRTFDIYSLSPDGNLLICRLRTGDQTGGDTALDPYANAVIDTRTGRQVALPVNGELINAVFLADGSLLARLKGSVHNELVLISKDWKVVDRLQEPAELKDRPLMAYIPA